MVRFVAGCQTNEVFAALACTALSSDLTCEGVGYGRTNADATGRESLCRSGSCGAWGPAIDLSGNWDRGTRLSSGLLALGLQPGDRVGVLEDNSIEAADLFAGAAIANLVRVPYVPAQRP